MGGYAALAFADACPGATVIALNPQTTLDRHLVPWETRYPQGMAQDWTGDFADAAAGARQAGRVYLAYDPLLEVDRLHVERLSETNVISLKLPLLGHAIGAWMSEIGILTPFVEGALRQDLDQGMCNALARRRRMSSRYYANMAQKTRSLAVRTACVEKILHLDTPFQTSPYDLARQIVETGYVSRISDAFLLSRCKDMPEGKMFAILKAISDSGDPTRSADLGAQVLQIRQGDGSIFLNTAECLLRLGRLADAERHAHAAIDLQPNAGNYRRILARIQFALKDYEAAVQTGEQAVLLDPGSVIGQSELARYRETLSRHVA